MVKQLDPSLQPVVLAEVTTLADCWLITRRDNVQLGFTSHDCDIVIDEIVYLAKSGFKASNLDTSLAANASSVELSSFLTANSISLKELSSGVYDFARFIYFSVDFTHPPLDLSENSFVSKLKGVFGKISISDRNFTVEANSLLTLLETTAGKSTSNTCRYKFGDLNCGVVLDDWEKDLTVSGLGSSNYFFFDSDGESFDLNYFAGGVLEWGSGLNVGKTSFVLQSTENSLTLSQYFSSLAIGDTFSVTPGCYKTFAACEGFGNKLNFGGEDKIPGSDAYYSSGYDLIREDD